MVSKWKKEYAGCYTNGEIRIERSEQFGGWNVYLINRLGKMERRQKQPSKMQSNGWRRKMNRRDSFKDNMIKMYSQWNYGYNFNAHIEAYWKAKKIVVIKKAIYWGAMNCSYQATLGDYDLDCKVGYGRTADEAIEELLIALDDRIR